MATLEPDDFQFASKFEQNEAKNGCQMEMTLYPDFLVAVQAKPSRQGLGAGMRSTCD